jgi:RNA polymerase sigma factor (sigma-70 family)
MYHGGGFARLQVMKVCGTGAQSPEVTAMHQPPEVEQLVEAARAGDAAAWDALVDRYLPLVTAVIRRLRLSPADADDVNQTVWLRLVEHLDGLREPRALPGWLATTARHEGLRLIKRRGRDLPVDPGGATFDTAEDSDPGEALVQDLRSHALREAMMELPEKRRALLLLLLADPPLSYDEISARLGIPKGSIGPTRARVLEQLRESRALRGWADEAPVHQGGARDVFLD